MVVFAADDEVQTVTIADVGRGLVTGEVGWGDVINTFTNTDSMVSSRSERMDRSRTFTGDSNMSRRGTRSATMGSESSFVSRREGRAGTMTRSMSKKRSETKHMTKTTSVADWAASTIGLESAPPGSQFEGSDNKRATPVHRRDRKRTQTAQSATLMQILDEAAEKTVNRTVEQPWCLETCMTNPSCQRICHPAEHATRSKKVRQESKTAEDAKAGGDAEGEGGEGALPRFGFPDWGQAGYSLLSLEEVDCVDPAVTHVLGLQLALHRKSSLQRYCHQIHKSKLPVGVGASELRGLVRSLKRNDHINTLLFIEHYEDAEYLFFLYEYFPCCTLRFLMQSQNWSQEQIVNIVREICGAFAHGFSINVLHLGLTLYHVLLPAPAANGADPIVCKIFGFGLIGVLYLDTIDHLCWAPEALERYNQLKAEGQGNFIQKMEGSLKMGVDSWSLGCIFYTLVAKQPPMSSEQTVLLRKWQFTLAIDMVDVEAKSLIEGFLNPQADRRTKPERALHHEWIRRRWRPPPGSDHVFTRVEEFCMSPLPKRLFGRFLSYFLEAEHLRRIARSFYSLDTQGTGVLSQKEMEQGAKVALRTQSSAHACFKWLTPEGATSISLMRFAETFAEDVIDGRALRHAFESLDDDGSEELNAEELFGALSNLDDSGTLTLQEVVDYIAACEGAAAQAAGADQDHQIDYSEFCELFPVRVKKMKALTDRMSSERQSSENIGTQFNGILGSIKQWIAKVEGSINQIRQLSEKTLERSEQGNAAALSLKKEFMKLDELLRNPPGPADSTEFEQMVVAKRKDMVRKDNLSNSKKKAQDKFLVEIRDFFGFDSFLQDQALHDQFCTMVTNDLRNLKQALNVSNKISNNVDQVKAHDAAENVCLKVGDALAKTKGQMEEYSAFVEAMTAPEAMLLSGTGGPQLSGRGLRARCGEDDNDPLTNPEENDEGRGNPMMRFITDVTQRLTGREASK